MVLLNAGNILPASDQDMDGSSGAKQADSWHKHEPFMMVEKQKNKGELRYLSDILLSHLKLVTTQI